MSELQDDIRSTAESIASDAEKLKRLEESKAAMSIDDPELPELAEQIDRLIEEINAKGTMQSILVDEATPSA